MVMNKIWVVTTGSVFTMDGCIEGGGGPERNGVKTRV